MPILTDAWSRIVRGIVIFLASVGIAVLFITLTPVDFVYATWLVGKAGPWNAPRGDVLIILSASTGPDGLLARDSYLRATYGVLAWRQGGFRRVVVCGREAGPAMRDFLIFSGVPRDAVQVESRSHSTRENALFAAEMLRGETGRRMLLTSDYHMFRAVSSFRRAGLQVDPLPIPDVRKYSGQFAQRLPIAFDLLRETAKILYYRWQGWI